MDYIVKNKNKESAVWSGNKKFIPKKTEDVVTLSFDEGNQIFTASVSNPSQRTLYLLEEGRLGLDLCKLNTGVSQRKHMRSANSTYNLPRPYVKAHYHPRWSRVLGAPNISIPGYSSRCVSVDNLSHIEVDVSNFVDRFRPNQKHTIGHHYADNWFTCVKAILVAQGNNGGRSYITCSNRIKVQYDYNNDMLILRQKQPPSITFDVNIQPTTDAQTYQVNLSNLSERAVQLLNNNQLIICTRYVDVKDHNLGGNSVRAHWGIDGSILDRRWTPLFKRKLKSRGEISDFGGNLSIQYTIHSNPPKGVLKLLKWIKWRHLNRNPLTITRTAYICVGYSEGGTICTLYTFKTNYNQSWSSLTI